jgi:hypothetical protein
VEPTRNDPVDDERPTKPPVSDSLIHGPNAPGVFGVVVSVVALFIGLFALVSGGETTGAVAIAVAAGSAAAGVGWVMYGSRNSSDETS